MSYEPPELKHEENGRSPPAARGGAVQKGVLPGRHDCRKKNIGLRFNSYPAGTKLISDFSPAEFKN